MGSLGWPELLLIAVVILVLFGSKKMPDAARSLGRSLRIFKSETKGLVNEDKAESPEQPAPAAAPQQLPAGQQGDGTTLNGVPVSKDQKHSAS
ncbi:Sec-independent protein translocase subunit TatA [Actinocorallia populi]|uniref:Sec-independent protein translocase subunit TatA n=1 Tax=Actinocorallia populi TaxID=2079200 RepID=UPI000D090110|nr:Sec-independent protein translocase subunit TatA [Actinocorallia populi]